jgi:hypothetical protein
VLLQSLDVFGEQRGCLGTARGMTRPVSIDVKFTNATNDPFGDFRVCLVGPSPPPQGLRRRLERRA